MTKKAKLLWLLIGMLLAICSMLLACLFWRDLSGTPEGRIIFQRGQSLYITDGEGKHVQPLGPIVGFSPSWSKDGNYIAIGCNDNGANICILNAKNICDWKIYPMKFGAFRPQTVREIPLPESCADDMGKQKIITVLDWSYDGKQLVMVCDKVAGLPKSNSVCILSLDGEANCWASEISQDVRHAVWSPKENLLAISGGEDGHGIDLGLSISEIYITGPNGKNKTFLAEGWNPEWSPDGKRIAFFRWGENRYPGIGIILRDGTDFHWVYESPIFLNNGDDSETERNSEWTANDALYFGCSDVGSIYGCRLAWSPDGRYLVFSANQSWLTKSLLLRLDLKTNQIIFLLPSDGLGGEYIEADWGP